VPVTQAAAGMRRVLALAYLLVWAWEEHVRAARLQKDVPTNRIVVLFDEVEAHLHPKWQRVFLPSLIKVVDGLLVKGQVEAISGNSAKHPNKRAASLLKKIPRSVQIIATTHAPLVLASSETVWNQSSDKLFDFDLDANRQVRLEEVDFEARQRGQLADFRIFRYDHRILRDRRAGDGTRGRVYAAASQSRYRAARGEKGNSCQAERRVGRGR
jgi:hypothetical protein